MSFSVDSRTMGLTEMYIQNRFPEPEEEPLFDLEITRNADQDTLPAATGQAGTMQEGFARHVKPVRSHTLESASNQEHPENAYDALKIKAQYNSLFLPF